MLFRSESEKTRKAFDSTHDENRYFTATQSQLVRREFKKHKLALISCVILLILYVTAIFCEFFSPHGPFERDRRYVNAPPQLIRLFDEDGFARPFVYGYEQKLDMETLTRNYVINKDRKNTIRFFVRGVDYELFGIFKTNWHLFGVDAGEPLYLLGTDPLGRDMLSRILHASRVSLFIGLIGVALSFLLGATLGALAGYYGGVLDLIIERLIEFLRSIPTIPLWMGLSAALPSSWSALQVYFGITIIISLLGWTSQARVVRGKFLELREEEFIMAARLSGTSNLKIIASHMIPGFMSYLIVSATLSVPYMILAETVLSFLGLGLRPPTISWGVLLQSAQNVQTVALSPWQLLPVVFVVLTVLAFNFVGDGLRDAADPYKNR